MRQLSSEAGSPRSLLTMMKEFAEYRKVGGRIAEKDVKTKYIKGERWYLFSKSDPTLYDVPSVSAITDMYPKPALPPAAAKATAEFVCQKLNVINTMTKIDAFEWVKDAYKREWKKKASLGTEVHKVLEQIDNAVAAGEKPRFRIASELRPYANQYAKFLREFAVEPFLSEIVVYNPEVGYGGRIDGLKWLTLPTGERILADVDNKSGASGVWAEAALQQTAYNHAPYYVDPVTGLLKPMPAELVTDKAYALWLRPEGYALLQLDTGEETWQQFKRLRATYQWYRLDQYDDTVVGKAINETPIRRGYRPPVLS